MNSSKAFDDVIIYLEKTVFDGGEIMIISIGVKYIRLNDIVSR